MKLRVLAFALAILAFFIFVGSPFQQAANAVILVDDAIIAIIVAALAAMGITFVTTGTFSSLNDYISDLLFEYAEFNGTSVSNLLSGVQSGTDRLGRLVINNRFVTVISLFADWIISEIGLSDNNTVNVVSPGATLGDLIVYNLPVHRIWQNNNGWSEAYLIISGTGYAVVRSDNQVQANFKVITKQSGLNAVMYLYNANNDIVYQESHAITNQVGDWYTYDFAPTTLGSYNLSGYYTTYTNSEIETALRGDYDVDLNNIGIDILTGNILLPTDDDNYSEGDGAVIDTGSEWGRSYGDVIDDIEDGFSDSGYLDTSITYDSEDIISEDVTDTPSQSISQNVSDYQVSGLTTVFPFCIPFDLYNFVACLAADPVAPSFTWRFYVPGICDETLEIDLSEFDAAAQILRTMELLLFCVGLAFVTRKIIRG